MNINYTFKSLLAETLRESVDSYMIEEITAQFKTPQQLLDVTEQELMSIRGIGRAKSRQIIAAIQLAKLMNTPSTEKYVIRSPRDVFDLLRYDIGFEHQEHFVVLFLSTKNHVIAKETLFIGTLNSCVAHPREIFKAACKHSAASIIIAHNHPSGSTDPSPEDCQLSTRVKECSTLMGIECLDSIIVSGSEFTSLKERGLI